MPQATFSDLHSVLQQPIKHWQDYQGQEGRQDNPSHHYRGQRSLDFRPGTGGKHHGQKAKGGGGRRHQDRTQAQSGPLTDQFIAGQAV